MKIKNLLQTVDLYFRLDKISWILLIISVILDMIMWIVWIRIGFSNSIIILTTLILLINASLAIIFDSKGQIVTYSLLGTALLCQILNSILVYHSIYF